MIKVFLQGEKEMLSINAMIDWGAAEDFIDKESVKNTKSAW